MENLKYIILFGTILFCSGLVLTVLTWPYALAVVEIDEAYPVACGIIFILVFTGQLMSIIASSMFSDCIEDIGSKFFGFLIVTFYFIIWFACGAGQLVVIVLMIINVVTNPDSGVKAYGAVIIALTIIYMFASSVYSTILFIWFYNTA